MATTLDDVRDGFDHELTLAGVLACRYDGRTRLSRLVMDELHLIAGLLQGFTDLSRALYAGPVDIGQHLRIFGKGPVMGLYIVNRVAVHIPAQTVQIEDEFDAHCVRYQCLAIGEIESHAILHIGPVRSDLHRFAGNGQFEDLPIFKSLGGRPITSFAGHFFHAESQFVGKGIGSFRRMENTKLGGGAGLKVAAQDADPGIGAFVFVQMLMSPDLGALVQPCIGAIGVMAVGVEDGGHFDLLSELLLQTFAHFGRGFRSIARVHDDPPLGSVDGDGVCNSPPANVVYALGELIHHFLVCAQEFVHVQSILDRNRTVGSGYGFIF